MNDTKQCIICNRILSEKDFKHDGRNVCNSCLYSQQKEQKVKQRFPDHKGRIPISDPAHLLHKTKYSQRYKPPPPPDDIVRCINGIDDNLSKLLTELKEMNSLVRKNFPLNNKR